MKKRVLWCVVIVAAGIAAPIVVQNMRPAVRTLTPVAPPEPEQRKIVTREQFDSIQTGMTYDQVVEIVGFDGTFDGERQETDDFGNVVNLDSYGWKNGAFGGFMNTVFADGRLIHKSEYQLPRRSQQ